MLARIGGWLRRRRREPAAEDLAAREEERQAADDVETTRALARSPLRDFTSDRGPRR